VYIHTTTLLAADATPEIVGVMIQSGIPPDHPGRTFPLPYLIIIWHTYYHEIKADKGHQQRIRRVASKLWYVNQPFMVSLPSIPLPQLLHDLTMFPPNFPATVQSPTYSHYSGFTHTPTTSPIATSYFPPSPYPPQPFQQQSFQQQPFQFQQQPYIPHTHSNLVPSSMSSYDEDHAGSSNPAKRAIEEQDRKGSLDEGGSSKKKRISLSCAQCTSLPSGV
jgi:hypothetical protein